jgi:hypothetical protein
VTVAANIGNESANAVPDIRVRRAGGVKLVAQGMIRLSKTSIVSFYSRFAVALSTYIAIGRANSASLITVTSEPVTANATGAIGAVTYAWARTAADAQPWVINSPAGQVTTFSTDCDQGEEFAATFICTISDQAGQVLATNAVAVDCANIYYGGGYDGSNPPLPGHYYA